MSSENQYPKPPSITGPAKENWPETFPTAAQVEAAKDASIADLAGEGRTTETIKGNADDIAGIAGEGWTTETIKGNADDIATHIADATVHAVNTDFFYLNIRRVRFNG